MADLNFPTNPSLDETYIANNVIYTWNGEYWEANTTNGFDSRYVEVAGDNMTGNLTLGTDKITLNADGSGTFAGGRTFINTAGQFQSFLDPSDGAGRGVFITNGLIRAGRSNIDDVIIEGFTVGTTKPGFVLTAGGSADFAGSVLIGGLLPSAPNISLNADGSIVAAGAATFGDIDISSTTTKGVIAYSNGHVVAQRDNLQAGASGVFSGYKGSTRTSIISNDGSATFTGDLTLKSPDAIELNIERSGQDVLSAGIDNDGPYLTSGTHIGFRIAGGDIGDETVRFKTDGSAEFAGDVVCSKLRANGPAWDNQFDSNGVLVYLVTTDATRKLLKAASNNGGAATEQFSVSATGQIAAKQTTIQPISSERRLKENIVAIDADTAWETIKSTPYYTYNFIDSDVTSYGPMADEVPAEMVVQPMEENEAGVMVARSDDEGPIRTYDNGMLQARLYTALQTALTRIEALEAEVTALKGTSTTDI